MKNMFRLLILMASIFTSSNLSIAQWVQIGNFHFEPGGGDILCFAVSGSNIYVGTGGRGVFLSTNSGTSWTAINSGFNTHSSTYVRSIAVIDTNLLVSITGGLYLLTKSDTSWTKVIDCGYAYISSLAVIGTNIFAGICNAGSGGGVFLSTDNGTSWTQFNNGLNNNTNITALAVSGTNLFAGTKEITNGVGPVFLSTNNGTSWTSVSNGLPNISIYDIAVSGTNLFAGTVGTYYNVGFMELGGVFLSTNNGASWTKANAGLWYGDDVYAFAVSGTNLFAGTKHAPNGGGVVFLSTNNGTSWTAVSNDSMTYSIYSLAVSGTYLFAGTEQGIVWRRPLSEMITSVATTSTGLPTHFSLSQNYPNPFNPSTSISFSLPSKSFVSLKIFDLIGREVATIVSEEMSAGNYSKQWNASNLPSGVYFYRLQAGSFTETKKLVLLR